MRDGNIERTTQRVLQAFAINLSDSDDSPIVYLALAALQLEHDGLEPTIRDQALHIIASGQGLERWEEAGAQQLAERKQVLQALREQLFPVNEW